MYSFLPLRWNHYTQCKFLFDDVFDISEFHRFPDAWAAKSDELSLAVFYKDALVGFALVDIRNTIKYICIHPDFQNCGLGSKLLTKILDLSVDKRSIWLTTAGDERLVSWYGRHGFRVVETTVEDGEFIGADMVLRRRCRSSSK
jgi:ribosomal protein S18 acetylase RimI-like enzyme